MGNFLYLIDSVVVSEEKKTATELRTVQPSRGLVGVVL